MFEKNEKNPLLILSSQWGLFHHYITLRAHTLCLIGHITLSPFFSPPPLHYCQCAPPLQASPPPLSLICPLFFSTDSVWEEPISICWQFTAALKLKHDSVENGTQSPSFKSPARQLAFCKNPRKPKQVVPRLMHFLLLGGAKEMSGAERKYRLEGRRAGKKSFIDPMAGKICRDLSRRSRKHWIKMFLFG